MFKKLINGKINLARTFWIYGFFGMFLFGVIGKISNNMLATKLGKLSVVEYYAKYFNPIKMDSGVVLVTIFHISALLLLMFYSVCISLAIWRSSAEYDKSLWLRYISRFSMIFVIFICLYINL